MKRLIAAIMALLPLFAMGQGSLSSEKKPFWASGYFKEMDNSYLEVVSASDYNLDTAKQKAVKEVLKRRSLATGTEANVRIEGDNVNVVSEHDLIVKSRIIDEYTASSVGGYTVFLLVQTAKNPTFSYEPVSISKHYKVGARPLVPGLAQIYKGSKGKGYSIIALQAASIAGIIFCESQRSSYMSKAKSASKASHTKFYAGKAKDWETGRNISIGVAAGIYVYNLIDGFVAKGKSHIVTNRAAGRELSFVPYASFDTMGLSVAYTF